MHLSFPPALLSPSSTSQQLPQPPPSPPNPPRQLNILLHNRNPLRMDSAQIRVLKQMHHKRLRGFL